MTRRTVDVEVGWCARCEVGGEDRHCWLCHRPYTTTRTISTLGDDDPVAAGVRQTLPATAEGAPEGTARRMLPTPVQGMTLYRDF